MSARSLRRPQESAEDAPVDAGFSLAELVVTLGVMTILLLIVGTTAVLSTRSAGQMAVRLDNATQAELGLAASSKTLRTAVLPEQLDDTVCTNCTTAALVKATGTEVTFYANLGRTALGPSLVTLRVVADPSAPGTGKLERRLQDPIGLSDGRYNFCNATSPGCAVDTHVLARALTWPSPGVFAYYDLDGLKIPRTSLTAADLARVSSVDLMMTVQTRPHQNRYRSVTAVERVRLPNVAINVVEDPS